MAGDEDAAAIAHTIKKGGQVCGIYGGQSGGGIA
jgi:hypothetical protein